MTAFPKRLPGDAFAVRTSGLEKAFKDAVALRGIDLTVPEGAVYVLLGPNGAGKTTTLRILLDLVRADRGTAEAFCLDSRRRGPDLRALVGYVPESHQWENAWMTVASLFEYHARYFPTWDVEYQRRLVRRLEIDTERHHGKLSKGQSRRVQLVLALAHRPPLLLLDEPTDGFDPLAREMTLSVLAEHIAESPTTLLISTHLVHEIERLADHVGVLRDGVLHAQLPTGELQRLLRRYRAEVPDQWEGAPSLADHVVQRSARGREVQWTVWGEEPHVSERLVAAGADVRDVRGLSLEEAALSLLRPEEATDVPQ